MEKMKIYKAIFYAYSKMYTKEGIKYGIRNADIYDEPK